MAMPQRLALNIELTRKQIELHRMNLLHDRTTSPGALRLVEEMIQRQQADIAKLQQQLSEN